MDRLTGRTRALKAKIDQGSIIYPAILVDHLLTAPIGRFPYRDLELIDVTNDIVSLSGFRDLTDIPVRIPVDDLSHISLLVKGSRIVAQIDEHPIVIGIIGTND